MTALPNTLALAAISDGSLEVAVDHRNNYAAIQTAVNALIADLSGGTAGALLYATSSSAIAYLPEAPTDGQALVWNAASGRWKPGNVVSQACRVYNSGNESISNGANVALTFDSERFDTDTIHDTGSNTSRLTCKTAGKYAITGHAEFAASTAGNARYLSIRLNGATFIGAQGSPPIAGGNSVLLTVTGMYDLAVNDYVELIAYQDTGGSLNVLATGNRSPEFEMARVA